MEKYINTKKNLEKISTLKIINYEYVDWSKVLYSHIWELEDKNIYDIIKELIKLFIIKRKNIFYHASENNEICLLASYVGRDDYDDILDKVYNLIKNNTTTLLRVKINNKINFKLLKNIKVFNMVNKHIKNIMIPNKIYITLVISQIIILFEEINEHIDIHNTAYLITFCDHFDVENMITQLFKKHGKKTITLQHGQYVHQTQNINVNCASYENFISDYMLVWGQVTIDEFKKHNIDESRLIKVGCPKFINNEDIKINKIENNKIGLLLNNENHSQSNIHIIKVACKIAKVLNKKLVVKPHPQNNMSHYLEFFDKDYLDGILDKSVTISDYARMIEFSLVHTSTTFVELNCMASPVFRYKDENYISMYNNDKDEFSSVDEFIEKYNVLLKDYESWKLYMKEIEEYFVCGVEGTTERYRNILNKYLEE